MDAAVHPWIGVVLLLSYAGMIVQFWRDNPVEQGMTSPGCACIDRVLVNEEEGFPRSALQCRPEVRLLVDGAFLVPVLFFTGIVIWEVYFSSYTTIEQQRIAV